MKLPFFSVKKQSAGYYLGLFLKEQEGIAMVMKVENGQMILKEKEKFSYSNGWEKLTEDVDDVLFRIEQRLDRKLEQVIFFVYSYIIDEKLNDIKKPYLQKIKELVKNLDLEALGYIECYEAVSDFLEKKEEMPLTAILIEFDTTNVSVFIYKGGKIAYSKSLPRTNNLIDDLLNSFESFKGRFLLPARIILYNSKDLNEESTKIVSYRWSEDFFVQIPRVEIIKEEEVIEGLIQVFAKQIKTTTNIVPSQESFSKQEVLGFVIGEEVKEKVQEVEKSPFKLPKLALPRLPKLEISKKICVAAGAFIIIASLFINEYFFHTAKLTVFLPAKTINQSLQLETEVSVATATADFSDSLSTTGKRDIGESAKGNVTLHNFDDKEKSFPKGTNLKTNGIPFVLDEEVKVASASLAADGSAKLPGKASAKASAANIGPEANIGKGQRFSIDDLSTSLYFAINDDSFSGGSKKQVQTVAKKDIEDLQSAILNKAKSFDFGQDKKNKEEIIPELSKINLTNLQFSKEIGEEATEISLKAKASMTTYSFDKNQIQDKLILQLQKNLDAGFSLEKDKINYKVEVISNNDKNILLKFVVNTKAIKKINQNDLLNKVIGKNKQAIQLTLKNNFSAQGYELNIKNPLPLLNEIAPFFRRNIQLNISSF